MGKFTLSHVKLIDIHIYLKLNPWFSLAYLKKAILILE